jgi:hypothetical protein
MQINVMINLIRTLMSAARLKSKERQINKKINLCDDKWPSAYVANMMGSLCNKNTEEHPLKLVLCVLLSTKKSNPSSLF